jgi:endo-1,4-beta-xylanase
LLSLVGVTYHTLVLTRRDWLKSAALMPLAGAAEPHLACAAAGLASLKEAAALNGIRYGAIADVNLNDATPDYRDLFLRQCALCAVDIWAPAFSVGPDAFNFTTSENAIIVAAADRGLPITGAHLLWYDHLPDWFTRVSGRRDAVKAILSYARGIAQHYRGKAWSWNVVNEAIQPGDGQPLGLRRCWPLQQVGSDYIDLTFRAARRGDPKAVLAYNDFDMELNTPEHERRRNALLLLLDDLQHRNTPIDAIGLQSHLKYEGFSQFDDSRYRSFLANIASRGLTIIITELDVLDVGAPSEINQRDQLVASIYDRFLSVALDELAVKAVVTWGLSNRYTWLNPSYSPEFARSDGLATRPLPFDNDLNPTRAFDAILKAFRFAPKRTSAYSK